MKIGLVCSDMPGTAGSGDIGTAFAHLSLLLAGAGHDVEIIYFGTSGFDRASPWAERFRSAKIKFSDFAPPTKPTEYSMLDLSADLYEYLQQRSLDLIIFPESRGPGHASVIAKRTGLAFDTTTLAVLAQGGSAWASAASQQCFEGLLGLEEMHMERQSIELSDMVISPSFYLRDWMVEAGWQLPQGTCVMPFFFEADNADRRGLPSAPVAATPQGDRTHIAFLGKFAARKGIDVFLDAITSKTLRSDKLKISFVGEPSDRSADDIRRFVAKRRPDMLVDLEIITGRDQGQAAAYLRQAGAVAVIPSLLENFPSAVLEVIRAEVPFIASAVGGIPEMVHPDDRRCLFEPDAGSLAAKLREVIDDGSWQSARPAFRQEDTARRWLAWVDSATADPPRAAVMSSTDRPDITVVVTHYERPALLEQNLRALSRQTDRAFEVIVVDDGSRSSEARAFLERIERDSFGLELRVLRQENCYVGAARNAAARQATTPYLIFLDDDNVPFPNLVEVLRRAISASSVDVVTCQLQKFRGNTDPTLVPPAWEKPLRFAGGPIGLGFFANCFGDTTGICRRSIFDSLGFHEIHGVGVTDWLLYLEASLRGYRLLSLPIPLIWYRVQAESISGTTDRTRNLSMIASAARNYLRPEIAGLAELAMTTFSGTLR